MAQLDTGLGWSAKEEWLMQTASTVAEISVVSGGYELPVIPNPGYADVMSAGALGYNRTQYNDGVRIVGEQPYIFGFIWNNGSYWRVGVVAYGANKTVKYVGYPDSGYTVYQGTIPTPVSGYSGWYTAYFYNPVAVSQAATTDLPIITANSLGAAAQQVVAGISISSDTINKLNPGYAVACVAKWYTVEGTTMLSPVLISSTPELVVMTQDGTTPHPDMSILNFLKDGRMFYMGTVSGIDPLGAITTLLQEPDLTPYAAAAPSKVFSILASSSFSNILILEAPDPYQQEGEESGEEGGDGQDQEDDPVEEETLPVPSVAGHGFCTIYVPSSQELGQMAAYLWSGAFDVTQVIKLFSNPMDSILGLSAVPVSLSGTSEQIYLGGVALTGITMPKYTGRTSVKVDFGTTTIKERWGSYLDYEPYTEFSIYLPFIGIKPLKADDIMGKTISLMYNIDILSGGCVAYIRPAGGSVLYEWSGQCALQIPVTARNYDNVFQTAMSVVGAVGAAVVAPASAPVLSGAVASAAVQAAATKPRIERSGSVNGITGFLGQLRPYIIRTIPEAFIPADQNKFIGYPAYINVDLASVTGYNEVDSIHLENVTATGAELDEIESILKGGVIF